MTFLSFVLGVAIYASLSNSHLTQAVQLGGALPKTAVSTALWPSSLVGSENLWVSVAFQPAMAVKALENHFFYYLYGYE